MRRHVTPRPSSLPTRPLTRLPFHNVGAALSLPDSATLHLSTRPGPIWASSSLWCWFWPRSLILASDCEPTLAAEASMGHLERRVRCSWGVAVLCSASPLLCAALLCLLRLSAFVPCRLLCQPSHIPLSMRSNCGYGCVWASTVVCAIAALVFLLPSCLRALPCTLEPHPQLTSPQGPHTALARRSRPTSDRRHCETCQPISEAHCCASRQADTRSRFHTRSCRQATLVSDPIFHPSSPSVCLVCLSVSVPPPLFPSPVVSTSILLAGRGPFPPARSKSKKGTGQGGGRRRSRGRGGMEGGVGVRTWPMYLRIHSTDRILLLHHLI